VGFWSLVVIPEGPAAVLTGDADGSRGCDAGSACAIGQWSWGWHGFGRQFQQPWGAARHLGLYEYELSPFGLGFLLWIQNGHVYFGMQKA
jgi:hypothetical protein